jgi:hypothetical protein
MTDLSSAPQHLFVVRLWQEPSHAAPPGQWRGSVEHVPSRERIYFVALVELDRFITSHTESRPGAPASPEAG